MSDAAAMTQLAQTDPIAYLDACLQRCQRDYQGYSMTWVKQDRVEGQLKPREVMEVHFRESPYSVFLRWREGAGKAQSLLYVEGENNQKLLVRPNDPFLRQIMGEVMELDPDGPEVRQAARIPITQFGFRASLERDLQGWKAARDKGQLKLQYEGEARPAEAGDRPCHQFRWTFALPEANGTVGRTLFVDQELGLIVGAVRTGEGGQTLGESFFRDIRVNPEFKPEQFQRSALQP